MRAMVIGAGRMGLAIAYDLVNNDQVESVMLVDSDPAQLDLTRSLLASRKVTERRVSVEDDRELARLMREVDGAVSAVPYRYNLKLSRLAIANSCHFCDLGGNNEVVRAQFALNEQAREAGVKILPDCGLAPGLVSVLVAAGVSRLDRTDAVHIRVGGLPLYPDPPLNYFLVFSPTGLINEYIEPVTVLRDGRICELPSLAEVETLYFPEPFGELEAFTTSGGASTLPETYEGRIRELDYKTIRYKGHCEMIRLLVKLGLTSNDPVELDGAAVKPRTLLEHLMVRNLPKTGPDIILLRTQVAGVRNGKLTTVDFELIDHEDQDTGLSAMMRATAFPAAVALQFLMTNTVQGVGVLKQEVAVPPDAFIKALCARGLHITEDLGPLQKRL